MVAEYSKKQMLQKFLQKIITANGKRTVLLGFLTAGEDKI